MSTQLFTPRLPCRTQPTDFAPLPEDVTTPSPPRVPDQTQQLQSRTAVHTVVSPSISWASKVKKGPPGAPVPARQDAVTDYELQQDNLDPDVEPETIVRLSHFVLSANFLTTRLGIHGRLRCTQQFLTRLTASTG